MKLLDNILYPAFKNWNKEKGNIWLYSDPHFNDKDQDKLRPNYIGDDEQVKRINSKVGKYDTIIFLGDIGDISFIRKIKGYKVLIKGNHDKGASNYKRKKRTTCIAKDGRNNQFDDVLSWAAYNFPKDKITVKNDLNDFWEVNTDNCLFDEVYEGAVIISPNIILSHEPISNFPYAINIHGHDHSNTSFKDNLHINLCAELINYTPVSLGDIIKRGFSKYTIDIHRETIDKANKKKGK